MQQSTEFCIKHLLEFNCADFPYTHNITQLLDQVADLRVKPSDSLTDPLRIYSNVLDQWGVKARYVKGYRSSLTTINKIISLVVALLEAAEAITFITNRTNEFIKGE